MRAGTAASPVSSTGVSNVRKICVGGDELHFECAHFIVQKSGSFPDSSPRKIIREPLHGHSYHVEVTLWGELLDDGFIIDFRLVRKEAIRLCREWSHHFILPLLSPCLRIQLKTKDKGDVRLHYVLETSDGDEYQFPQNDCLPLSIKHSSSEELAEAFWLELKSRLSDTFAERKIVSMGVTITERLGASSTFEGPLNQKLIKRGHSKASREDF